MTRTNERKPKGFWARLNRAVTEVGIEHFDDDADWDQRVKLPEWQLARLRERQQKRREALYGKNSSDHPPEDDGTR